MRRVVIGWASAAALTAGAIGAVQAGAGPVIPLHEATTTTAVHDAVHALNVISDGGSVTVKPGARTSVTAHEQWNYEQPRVDVSVKKGVLNVRVACPTLLQGPLVYASDPGLDQCAADLTVVVPVASSLAVTAYDGAITTSGVTGNQTLHSDNSAISVTGTRGPTLTAEAEGPIAVADARAGELKLTSYNSRVTADKIVATTASLRAEGSEAAITNATVRNTLSLVSYNTGITAEQVSAGELSASAEGGVASLDTVHVADVATVTNDNGGVSLKQLTARSLHSKAYSSSTTVRDSAISGDTSLWSGNGPVDAQSLRAGSLSVEAATGTATLTSAVVAGLVHLVAQNGGVGVQDLRAGQLVAEAAGGSLSITSTTVVGQLSAKNDNGGVTLSSAKAANVNVSATGGSLSATDVSAPTVSASNENGPVTLTTSTRPQHVDIQAAANIALTVPAGVYAVNAVSDSRSPVTISGITIHSDAKRTLTARTTQGSIAITGRS